MENFPTIIIIFEIFKISCCIWQIIFDKYEICLHFLFFLNIFCNYNINKTMYLVFSQYWKTTTIIILYNRNIIMVTFCQLNFIFFIKNSLNKGPGTKPQLSVSVKKKTTECIIKTYLHIAIPILYFLFKWGFNHI